VRTLHRINVLRLGQPAEYPVTSARTGHSGVHKSSQDLTSPNAPCPEANWTDTNAGMYLDHDGHLHANNSNVRHQCTLVVACFEVHLQCRTMVCTHDFLPNADVSIMTSADAREKGAELEAEAEGEVQLMDEGTCNRTHADGILVHYVQDHC
jgi:hypothetical protein